MENNDETKSDIDVIDETVEFVITNEVDGEKLEPKFKTGGLKNVVEKRITRQEAFKILEKFKNDDDFSQVPLPLDYIASNAPHLWDDSVGMTVAQYLDYEDTNIKLINAKTAEGRKEVMKRKLKRNLMKKYEKKLLNISSMKKRNQMARKLLKEEMSKETSCIKN